MTDQFDVVSTLWGGRSSSEGSRDRRRLVGVPDAASPRQILPWQWSSIAATAARRSDDRSTLRRVRDALAVGVLLAARPISRRHRLTVHAGGSLVEHIASELAFGDCEAIAICGPPRANQKPVLQFHDRRGRSLGFVKVGWSGLTQRLLDQEHAALEALGEHRHRDFVAPTVIGRGTCGPADWLALSPVTVGRQFSPRLGDVDHLAASVRATGVESDDHTADAAYVSELRSASADLPMTSAAVDRLLDRHGHQRLPCAGGHGDFVPWNMLSGRPRPALWDWERYRSEVPTGFDRLHFRVQSAMRREGVSLTTAARYAAGQLDSALPELPPSGRGAQLDWYLADLLARYERDAVDHPTDRLSHWAADLQHLLKERLESP